MKRVDKVNYYLNMAEVASERGTCLRRNYGAVIVKDDRVVSTGYNGAPRGRKNCCDIGECIRSKLNVPRGTKYELCRSLHAENNAIINASKYEMEGATLYLVGVNKDDGTYVENANSCSMCKRIIINAGILKVIVRNTKSEYTTYLVSDWIDNDDSLEGNEGY